MLYAVIVGQDPASAHVGWWDEERRTFLQVLEQSGRLALEGTYGEGGSLMLIEADSTNEALAFLQNDPCVLASGRVQIHPLVVNVVGNLGEPAEKPRRKRSTRRSVRRLEHRKPTGLGG